MWRTIVFLIVVIAVVVGIAMFSGGEKTADNGELTDKTSTSTMNGLILKSPAFENEGNIPSKYTCDGENANPPLQISNVPEDAKSLALVVDDPDATDGGTFDHWIIWNISPQITEIKEGETPENAVEGRNNFGNTSYGGPCPPQGDEAHRYIFKLYALDQEIELKEGSDKDDLEDAMTGHILGTATFLGYYGR